MIIFNENLKDDELREMTIKEISPLFKKLEELTLKNEIEWKSNPNISSSGNFMYTTDIIKEDNEQWHIKIFPQYMLMIEWTQYNNKKQKRYAASNRCYRTKFYSSDEAYMNLMERIQCSPEILSDCIANI
jgi:hypothetical protein